MELASLVLQPSSTSSYSSSSSSTRVSRTSSKLQQRRSFLVSSSFRGASRSHSVFSPCNGSAGCQQLRLRSFRSFSSINASSSGTSDTREHKQVIIMNSPGPDGSYEARGAGGSRKQQQEEEEVEDVGLDDQKMVRVTDKLIEVFLVDKPTPTDWRKLLVFSKKWDNLRPHFYKRCHERAENEDDPGKQHQLLKLARKLKEVDEDVQRQNELLDVIMEAQSEAEMAEIVRKRRKDFTKEFFVHIHTVAESYYDNLDEQRKVAKIGNMCISAVQAYDAASESMEALDAAQLKLQDIINSPSLDAACRKIDRLAEKNQLDSTLVLMLSKAWSAAKETNMAKDEVKDIMYHLYKTAIGNLQRLMPKEIRIVKYLLKIDDPEERLSALRDAFTPGQEIEGRDVDSLYTTPEKLHTWMKAVVEAYYYSPQGSLLSQAKDLMNPKIIPKLEELIKIVQDNFM